MMTYTYDAYPAGAFSPSVLVLEYICVIVSKELRTLYVHPEQDGTTAAGSLVE